MVLFSLYLVYVYTKNKYFRDVVISTMEVDPFVVVVGG